MFRQGTRPACPGRRMNRVSEICVHKVTPEEEGARIDSIAAHSFSGVTRSAVQKAVELGLLECNGRHVVKKYRVRAGDLITLADMPERASDTGELIAEQIPLTILYEDDFLVAVSKPAGMVVHPGNGNPTGTLVQALASRMSLARGFGCDRPGIVHRLDKDTSGVLLAAKTQEVHAALAAQFMERTVQKWYLGFCIGHQPRPEGTIEADLVRDRANPLKRAVRRGGKAAKTGYWVLGYHCGIALMRFYLHTGRNHQIRAHCAHIHMPILGDRLYAVGDPIQRIEPLERPFAHKIAKVFSRQALHAHRIVVVHPVTGEALDISAPIPDDFALALDGFGPYLETAVDAFPAAPVDRAPGLPYDAH